nr:MAG TPA: hypothetical protein [Caudoviricetes sp.]
MLESLYKALIALSALKSFHYNTKPSFVDI